MGLLQKALKRLRSPARQALVRDAQTRAEAARQAGDWVAAAGHLAAVMAARPESAGLRVQYAHALKEAGMIAAAERSYRIAADLAPASTDALVHLADMLARADRPADARIAYADILRRDPDHHRATRMLAEMGGRANLPDCAIARGRQGALIARIGDAATATTDAIEAWVGGGLYPPGAYDRFRHACPVVAPPAFPAGSGRVMVRIEATTASPAMLRATLHSLIDQTHADWRARVVGFDDRAGHPVATIADRERRIRFDDGVVGSTDDGAGIAGVLTVMAGVVLDPNALAWFLFAATRTGAACLFADHDRVERDWRSGPVHRAPALFGYFDPLVIAATNDPPVAVFVAGVPDPVPPTGLDCIRHRILAASKMGQAVVHVPRLLASILQVPAVARGAPRGAAEVLTGTGEVAWGVPETTDPAFPLATIRRRDGAPVASVTAVVPATPGRIAVLIPTRDSPDMLDRCIAGLQARATHPDRLDIVILDNRGETDAGRAMLARIAASGQARVVAHDAAFNWSAMNNRILTLSDAETLVFANDDVAMLSDGWDVQVEGFCAQPGVGAVGARLLYPDGSYQHAGIAFGLSATQLCIHEGLGHHGDEGGPLDRWLQTRRVAAVTGAFLATSRAAMQAVGGFDEALALAYNDIDYCFRIRASGRSVLYTPALTLTHHESQTRGRNVTRDSVAWDEGELQTLARTWGPDLRWDPAYDAHYALRGQPFDGYREPPLSDILTRIDRAATAMPWGVGLSAGKGDQDDSACRL